MRRVNPRDPKFIMNVTTSLRAGLGTEDIAYLTTHTGTHAKREDVQQVVDRLREGGKLKEIYR